MIVQPNLDLLLINPGGRLSIYQDLGRELAAIEPPVWAGLMPTFIQKKGFNVDLLDADALDLTPDQVADYAAELNPRLTAVVVYGHQPSASTQVMPAAGAICSAIKLKKPKAKLMLLGGHVASLPEQTLSEEHVDYVCTGEGPYTLLDMLGELDTREPIIDNVRGICYMDGGALKRTAPAPLVDNLDLHMPGIAWNLLPMDRYRAHNWHCYDALNRQPYAAIYTSLGCPYKCSFCCIQAPFKEGEQLAGHKETVNTYRRWGVDAIMAQIDTLVNDHGVRNIKIADEMFVLNRKHVIGICDAIIEREYDLNIWAYARVDTIQDDMPEKLKKAGFNWLSLGIESANARVRADVQKGYGQDQIISTVKALQDAGIYTIANYIFGLPEDNLKTMQETLDLAMELNCEFANFYCTMAYPGSALYDEALYNGWELPSSWSAYSQHSVDSFPLPTKHLAATEVLRFRDAAFNTYYTNTAYLDSIRAKFGEETVQHIIEMTSRTLERANA